MKKITLKVKDIKEYVAGSFGNIISKDHYVFKKSDNEFKLTVGNFTYIYNILITSWSDHYSINVRLWISQNEVEEIFQKIVGKWRHNLTFAQSMIERICYSPDGREIVNGPDLTISLIEDEDVFNATKILKTYYDEIAKPYFCTFRDIKSMDNFINNPPFEYIPAYVGGLLEERCLKGLIIAKLVHNPNYERLVEKYDELIKRTKSDDAVQNYNKLKLYLKNNLIFSIGSGENMQ